MGSDLDERPGLFQGDVAVFKKGLTKGTFQHDIYIDYMHKVLQGIQPICICIYIYIHIDLFFKPIFRLPSSSS